MGLYKKRHHEFVMSSRVRKWGEGGSFFGEFFISVVMRRGYSRAFSRSSALGVFQTPNRYLFSPLCRQGCSLALQCKSNLLKRFEPPLGLVPFGGECALILPLKVGAEENKGANCSRPTFAVLFSGATTLQCKSNRNRPQNSSPFSWFGDGDYVVQIAVLNYPVAARQF